jgi:hypothetical protein
MYICVCFVAIGIIYLYTDLTLIANVHQIFFLFLATLQFTYNRAISKYVIRKHLCGAIIQ